MEAYQCDVDGKLFSGKGHELAYTYLAASSNPKDPRVYGDTLNLCPEHMDKVGDALKAMGFSRWKPDEIVEYPFQESKDEEVTT
jgi:hypothetical protein